MKRTVLIVVLALALALLLFLAAPLYRSLSQTLPPEDAGAAEETAESEETVEAEELPPAEANLAPDFTVLDSEGESRKLSEFFGRPIVLNFWATWCPPCRSELPGFDAAFAEYGDRVAFLMVDLTDGSRDTVEVVKAFLEENGYAFPVYYDTALDAADTYGVYSIPMTCLIDSGGSIVFSQIGAIREETLFQKIEELLAE